MNDRAIRSGQLKTLGDLPLSMEDVAERQDLPRYEQRNLRLQDQFMLIADNQMLANMYLTRVNQAQLFRQRGWGSEGSLNVSCQAAQGHIGGLAAARSGDGRTGTGKARRQWLVTSGLRRAKT